MKPNARTSDLEIRRETGELFIEDRANNQSIHLNPTAAFIWEKCDGKKEMSEIAFEIQSELGMRISDRVLAMTIGRLMSKNLLDIVI